MARRKLPVWFAEKSVSESAQGRGRVAPLVACRADSQFSATRLMMSLKEPEGRFGFQSLVASGSDFLQQRCPCLLRAGWANLPSHWDSKVVYLSTESAGLIRQCEAGEGGTACPIIKGLRRSKGAARELSASGNSRAVGTVDARSGKSSNHRDDDATKDVAGLVVHSPDRGRRRVSLSATGRRAGLGPPARCSPRCTIPFSRRCGTVYTPSYRTGAERGGDGSPAASRRQRSGDATGAGRPLE